MTRITRKLVVFSALLSTAFVGGRAIADQTHVPYNLAAGAKSAPISIPIANSPVILSCGSTTVDNVGEGQVTMVRSSVGAILDWTGYDFATKAFQQGYTQAAGTHIIYCDFASSVEIDVENATQVYVKNNSSSAQTGVIMLVY